MQALADLVAAIAIINQVDMDTEFLDKDSQVAQVRVVLHTEMLAVVVQAVLAAMVVVTQRAQVVLD